MSDGRSALAVQAAGLTFQNPIVLAAGTAAYGHELADVVDLPALGGLVTKAVSPEPREGAPAPRVAEFDGGMINAIGLANPGVEAVRREHLPWLARSIPAVRKLANVVGFAVGEFAAVIEQLELSLEADTRGALDGYEINVSCPNVKAGGMEFGADPAALAEVVRLARSVTARPIFVKLSPTLPDIARSAAIAVDAGADGLTLVNTIPGLVIDVDRRRPALGFGTGGVSGTALLPVGVLATWKVRRAVKVPLMGVGGVSTTSDALQYLIAGASLVGMGTAMLRDPRAPERVVAGLAEWCDRHGIRSIAEVVGTLQGARVTTAAGAPTAAIPIVALDFPDAAQALAMATSLGGRCRFYKVGSELFTTAGPDIVRRLREEHGADVFLDLKFHDIPNTVAGAVRSSARLGARLLTVHASGGAPMLRAAREAADETAGGACGVLGVTLLTSLTPAVLGAAWGRADVPDMEREVMRLAASAAEAGLHGVVCSGAEVGVVRGRFGDRLAALVPGIRLAGGEAHDQSRVMTPAAAQRAGARYLILGRAVTADADPVRAMDRVLAELRADLGSGAA